MAFLTKLSLLWRFWSCLSFIFGAAVMVRCVDVHLVQNKGSCIVKCFSDAIYFTRYFLGDCSNEIVMNIHILYNRDSYERNTITIYTIRNNLYHFVVSTTDKMGIHFNLITTNCHVSLIELHRDHHNIQKHRFAFLAADAVQ